MQDYECQITISIDRGSPSSYVYIVEVDDGQQVEGYEFQAENQGHALRQLLDARAV